MRPRILHAARILPAYVEKRVRDPPERAAAHHVHQHVEHVGALEHRAFEPLEHRPALDDMARVEVLQPLQLSALLLLIGGYAVQTPFFAPVEWPDPALDTPERWRLHTRTSREPGRGRVWTASASAQLISGRIVRRPPWLTFHARRKANLWRGPRSARSGRRRFPLRGRQCGSVCSP